MTIRRLLLTLALLLVPLSAKAEEPIKIGAVFSVTGPASFLGEPEKNTALMLADMINENGGVLGRQIEMIVYDDETDVNKCVLAVDKLLKKDHVVAVIGPSVSGNTLAVMNKFPAAKVPLISCAAAEKIVNPVNPWVFKTPQSDRHAVTRILEHAKEQGYKNIAIITVSNGFGQAGRAVLQELVPEMGFTLVADEVYGPKDTDMTAQLTSIKGKNPDAIICWGTNPGPAVIAKNRVQLGMDTPLYMSHGVASKKFIELAGSASEGLLLPAGRLIVANQISDDNPQKPVVTEYIEEYEAEFNQPISSFGGYAYDALMLVTKAIEMGGTADPTSIRDNIEKIDNFVATGGVFNFSAEDHNGLDASAFEMVIIENGDWKIVE
ncbi:ABC transporter substrate-binding protein [Oceanidesulfovibrio marinus]|uniref:ABC transporter substrate-binding protein n=1 Tax=Oceanidesulfovibrio marinus TaxID=370038 RepID=A0ABX6NHM9_9BACT|nr:ABC transporter substrate-binding protein [Oceanidesulfovibrio marinus]QJT09215.1 ABC transporter substrate-binding protein [Oceanidesulfovibrio marinus]